MYFIYIYKSFIFAVLNKKLKYNQLIIKDFKS